MLSVNLVSASALAILASGCSYSHPAGGEFDYYSGGPNRAFLMHIAWNRKLCADPNSIVLLGEDIVPRSIPWRERLTIRDLIEGMQWKPKSEGDLVGSSPDRSVERVFLFGIIGIWRNDEGRFETIPRRPMTAAEFAKVRLKRGDIVVRLERRVCF